MDGSTDRSGRQGQQGAVDSGPGSGRVYGQGAVIGPPVNGEFCLIDQLRGEVGERCSFAEADASLAIGESEHHYLTVFDWAVCRADWRLVGQLRPFDLDSADIWWIEITQLGPTVAAVRHRPSTSSSRSPMAART